MGKKTDLKDSCAYCEITNCIDLFRHTKDHGEFEGGELYVYKKLNREMVINEGLQRYVCSNGKLLQSGCFIVGPANVSKPDDYLTNIGNSTIQGHLS